MNDVFISYRSTDRPWASRLANDLRAQGVVCFLDTTSIRKGEGWEKQILQSLLDSRHLVLLWTTKASESDWVEQELNRFRQIIDPRGDGQTAGRLVIPINLEGQNATLSGIQQYSHPTLQEAYRSAPGAVNLTGNVLQEWNAMVREIAQDTTDQNPRMPVSKVVFAMTKAILQNAPLLPPSSATETLDDFLSKVGVSGGDVSDRYGDQPEDWKPYGTSKTIAEVLDDVLSDPAIGVNAKLRELNELTGSTGPKRLEIRWEPVDVVTPNTLSPATIQKLSTSPYLMVIDPISVFSFRMFRRFVELSVCFANPSAAVVVMTPFQPHPTLGFLRESLIEYLRTNLAWYCEPIPYQPTYANCSINVSEPWEIRRLVLASLGRRPEEAGNVGTSSSNHAHAIIGVGG
jgi:TIR domain